MALLMIFPGYAQVVVGPSEFVVGPSENRFDHVRGQRPLKEAELNPTSSSLKARQSILKGSVNLSAPLIQPSAQIQKNSLIIQSDPDAVLKQSNSTQSATQKALQQASALNFKKIIPVLMMLLEDDEINTAPVADAGSDQSVTAGENVTLNGSSSTDANGDALTYTWSFLVRPSGSTATLTNVSSASPSFTADVVGTYVIGLIVNDGTIASLQSSVNVTVTAPSPTSFSISSSLIGYNTSGLILRNNTELVTPASGANHVLFQNKISNGSLYSVSVYKQPRNSTCSVINSTGIATNDITSVIVNCVPATVVTIAGSFNDTSIFANPSGIAFDSQGNLFVIDTGHKQIKKVSPNGVISTFAGTGSFGFADGAPNVASFGEMWYLAIDSQDNIYVADYANCLIRKITPVGFVSTILGLKNGCNNRSIDGNELVAELNYPLGISVDGSDNIWITEYAGGNGSAGNLRKITQSNFHYIVETIKTGLTRPYGIYASKNNNFVYYINSQSNIIRYEISSGAEIWLNRSSPYGSSVVYGVNVDNFENVYYYGYGNGIIYRGSYDTPNNFSEVLAGSGIRGNLDGIGTTARFYSPVAGTIGPDGNLYISDNASQTIRKIILRNVPPMANAGANQSVTKGVMVTLDGSASTDANGDILTYSWSFISKPSGSSASLTGSTTVSPSFTADVAGSYVIGLTVNDGKVSGSQSSVTVTALNRAPVANAGGGLSSVNVGTLISLNGTNSYDPDGDLIAYSWVFYSKPAGSSAVLLNNTTSRPFFMPDIAGTYIVALIVSDGQVISQTSSVALNVTDPSLSPVAVKHFLYGGLNNSVYLGCLNCNSFETESVCNSYGTYGSSYAVNSIWNEYGTYGSTYNSYSPWNSYSSNGPIIIGSDLLVYGYFTANSYRTSRTNIAGYLNVLNYYKSTNNLAATRIYACGN